MKNNITPHLINWKFLVLLLSITFSLSFVSYFFYSKPLHKESITVQSVYLKTPKDIRVLTNPVHAIIYQNSVDLNSLPVAQKKLHFIAMVLPSILLAKAEHQTLQNKVHAWLTKKPETIKEKLEVKKLLKQFKVNSLSLLYNALYTPPTSLILAQSIIESGWGTSRFFREANNIFGIWSYNKNEKRLQASQMRGDKAIYVRAYDSIDSSIKDYLTTLSRSYAFAQLREQSVITDDPYELCCYLEHYSERRIEYVKELAIILTYNNLIQYDSYTLSQE
jgi:Bax protein